MMGLPWRRIVFALISAVALAYLAIANARGYVPFVGAAQHGARGSGTVFVHK
jgi:hypothetical protein